MEVRWERVRGAPKGITDLHIATALTDPHRIEYAMPAASPDEAISREVGITFPLEGEEPDPWFMRNVKVDVAYVTVTFVTRKSEPGVVWPVFIDIAEEDMRDRLAGKTGLQPGCAPLWLGRLGEQHDQG